jgi:hypothetical protein
MVGPDADAPRPWEIVTVDTSTRRRPWLAAAAPTNPAPEGGDGGAGGGGAPPPAPGTGTPPAGTGTPPPATDDVERLDPSDQSSVRRFTQRRLDTMLAREKDEGARKVLRDRFGVDKLEDLDEIVKTGREAQRANLTADQRLQAELADERAARARLEADIADRDDRNRITDRLANAQCTLPAAAIAELRGAEGVQAGADTYTIDAAIARLRTRAPQLFAQTTPGAGAPGAPAGGPAAPDPGAPPAAGGGQAAGPFGSAGRAEAARRFGDPNAKKD